jgi:hypothetical protein
MVSILIKIKCLTYSPLLLFSAIGLLAKGANQRCYQLSNVSTHGH